VRQALLFIAAFTLTACLTRPRRAAAPEPSCPALAASPAAVPDTLVYDTLSVTTRPQRISAPRVEYPDRLREDGVNGRVVVDVVIDPSGHAEPGTERVVAASHREFVAPTMKLLRESRFCPGTVIGRPVRVRVLIPINFSVTRAGP